MKYFQKFAEDIDVQPLLEQLHAHPELWGANTLRTAAPDSPHAGVPDIWIRTKADFSLPDGPFLPIYYPAWYTLPALRDIVFPLATLFHASVIGNILITRIPVGGQVFGHIDHGWSPNYFNVKAYVVLAGNDRCRNWCETEAVVMQTGEGWLFTNTRKHGVINDGDTDRISLIATFRVD